MKGLSNFESESTKWLEFVVAPTFTTAWKSLGLDERDLLRLEAAIVENPTRGTPMVGTGGLRKLRFAIYANQGKSGGARVGYAYFERYGVVLLAAIFAKNDQSNLTGQQKNAIKTKLQLFEKYLHERK